MASEQVLVVDPFNSDDRYDLNLLFEQGWETTMRLVGDTDDGLRVYLHLEICRNCNPEEGCDVEPDEEYEQEKRRRLEEFERLHPPRPDDDETIL